MNSVIDRAREGRRLMEISLTVSVTLAVAKILGGIFGRSHALVADGIESSLDVLNAGFLWAAIQYAGRPPDDNHPYGHGKMESLAALIAGVFLVAAGLLVGVQSVRELIRMSTQTAPPDLPAPFTLLILAVTIGTKEILYRWMRRHGRAIGSRAVEADAWHHRSDALTSLAAVCGISLALIGGPSWAQADDWAALFSCGLIVFNGVGLLRGALGDVLDTQASAEIVEKLLAAARTVPGVLSVEKCRVRTSGLARLADLHVRVDGNNTVHEGHRIGHAVKDRLMQIDKRLADVTVHIEPDGT